jgi:gliding motility-associated-like protein/uncharacterized repeat protein (TIGR01451 family)
VDLSVLKEIESPKVRYGVGDNLIFIVTLSNLSDIPAINIPVEDYIQAGFEYVSTLSDSNYYWVDSSGQIDPGQADPNGRYGIWIVDRLEPGEQAVLRLEVTVTDPTEDGILYNIASIPASYTNDVNPDNNQSEVSVLVDIINQQESGFLYNQFSPNGDGYNDFLIVKNVGNYRTTVGKGVSLQVFDRYGNSVYENKDYDNSWDGTGNSGELPKGTYFYILDLGDGSDVRKGWIQIIR